MNLEAIGRNMDKWFKNMDNLEVGSELSNFCVPSMVFLMSIIFTGELVLFVDGEFRFSYTNATARGIGMFVNECKNVSITLTESIHRISFLIPTRDGIVLFERFIIPTRDGVPIATNNTQFYELGLFDGESYNIQGKKETYTTPDSIILSYSNKKGEEEQGDV